MAEAYLRIQADPATPGYRPLPSGGPARGADLRTTVYAGLGIALGILAGTFVADGTVQRMISSPHQMAQVRSNGTAATPSAAAPAVARVQTPIAATPPAAAVAVSVVAAEHQEAAPAGARLTTAETPVPAHVVKLQPPSARAAEVAAAVKPQITAAVKSGGTATATARKVSVLHRHRSWRRLASRKAAWARRHGRSRHRLHGLLRTALTVRKPAGVQPAEPETAAQPFGFTVEGSLTVSNFDQSLGMLQTYEGENFALGNTASAGSAISWLHYPAGVHYRCDQSGNCTLLQGRAVVGSAKRTK